jgi:hypothetical protein
MALKAEPRRSQIRAHKAALDKQYHIGGSPLLRFAWFRRKQQLHFVHHTHGNSNFALIDNFWDRLLGTYRSPDADDVESRHLNSRTRSPAPGGQAGISRSDTISCTLGRQRSGPSIDMWSDCISSR